SIGPISSSSRKGSKSENAALGNGRRTRKPAPSNVSMLFTTPAIVRLLLVRDASSLNASLTIDIRSPLRHMWRLRRLNALLYSRATATISRLGLNSGSGLPGCGLIADFLQQ